MECCVLLSCYNGRKYIAEQLNSIIHQQNVELKILIRDDGSTDSTLEILDSFKNKYPSMIEIIEGKNVGIHNSFFELIKRCPNSDFIAFSDQDDIWDSDKLYTAISSLKSKSCDFYSCAAKLCDENSKVLNRDTSDKNLHLHYQKKDNCVLTPGTQGCTIVISKKLKDYILLHDMPSYYGHDTWISIIAAYFFKCIYDENTHMLYRQHNNSWTGNRTNRLLQLKKEIVFFFSGMSRYSMLAQDIINRFKCDLSENSYNTLSLLSKDKKTIKDRFRLIINNKFRKYGFFKNVFFKLCILIGVI